MLFQIIVLSTIFLTFIARCQGDTVPGYKSVVYFASWKIYSMKFRPSNLPVPKLTHVHYAFATVNPDTGTVFSPDPWADLADSNPESKDASLHGSLGELFALKVNNRNLKVLLSIGGFNNGENFTKGIHTPAKRQEFVRSSVAMVQDLGFDGLDIDWEFPRSETDGIRHVELLQACRKELDAASAAHQQRYHFLLAIAISANPAKFGHLRLKDLNASIDYINLMAYDYAGGNFSAFTGYQSNLYPSANNPQSTPFDTNSSILNLTRSGIQSSKIILGIPMYGRGFSSTDGLGQPYVKMEEREKVQTEKEVIELEPGIWSYKALPKPGASSEDNLILAAASTYDSKNRSLFSYDTPATVKAKSHYVLDNHLGGTMFWEASTDSIGPESLVGTSYDILNSKGLEQSHNCITYPLSRFKNLQSGTAANS